MKNIFTLILISAFVSFTIPSFSASPVANVQTVTTNTKVKKPSYKQLKKTLEQSLGRKLKFKEKFALRLQSVLPEVDPALQRRANNQALAGFILSCAGIVLFAPLLIPGLIISNSALAKERMNPGILENGNYGLAKAGSIIGYVGLGILLLLIIIVVIVFSSGFNV